MEGVIMEKTEIPGGMTFIDQCFIFLLTCDLISFVSCAFIIIIVCSLIKFLITLNED